MAYDRYDPRDERSRWSREREDRDRGRRDERGFFERAGDEVASWFGDEDAEGRRRDDRMRDHRDPRGDNDRERMSRDRDRDWYSTRGLNERGGFSESDYNPSWRRELGPSRDRGYRPLTGDYGRGEREFGDRERFERDRSDSEWGRDPYRRTSRAGTSDWSDRSRHEDPHYHSWRERHMSDLDRDYDDYRRENQSRFEDDFTSWRERRQQKRGLLGQIREHMEVVGNDDGSVGTVDRIAGDRIILAKSDPESGGSHHSLSCSDIERVEENRVILGCSADQAREHWRDESRSRALFEREDQGEMGPGVLDRSFSGTYR